MAGQNPERRDVVRVLSMAAVAAQFPGFQRWAFAGQHEAAAPVAAGAAEYSPLFFTPAEYRTVEHLAELIIPKDGTGAGAREAGVSEFIDFMAASDPQIQYPLRYGLVWLDAHSLGLHAKTFAAIDEQHQTEILRHLAYKEHHRAGEEDGQAFFHLLRSYTVMGYYTSRVGLEQLDYPGLRVWSESPGCPHTDDPEHRHLPTARF